MEAGEQRVWRGAVGRGLRFSDIVMACHGVTLEPSGALKEDQTLVVVRPQHPVLAQTCAQIRPKYLCFHPHARRNRPVIPPPPRSPHSGARPNPAPRDAGCRRGRSPGSSSRREYGDGYCRASRKQGCEQRLVASLVRAYRQGTHLPVKTERSSHE